MNNHWVEIDWTEFLGRPRIELDPGLAKSVVAGRRVLITGAGGSIGSGLARAVVAGQPQTLVLLDSWEGGLYECYRQISGIAGAERIFVVPVIGSVCDGRLLSRVLSQNGVELVLHVAAYKHVPLMEQNPFSAIANNAIGTYRLVVAACQAGVVGLTMVSTDKAVNPRSIMGASKRIAELVVLSHSTDECRMNAVRLANVLGSSGSVTPIFQEQMAKGLSLTVTDPGAARYFLTPAEAEAAILKAAASSVSGKILIADCGEAHRVVDLARYIGRETDSDSGLDLRIEYIGLRPGDKLCEELVFDFEQVEPDPIGGMRVVASPHLSRAAIGSAIERLDVAADRHDSRQLMGGVMELVPTYQPSQAAKPEDSPEEAR